MARTPACDCQNRATHVAWLRDFKASRLELAGPSCCGAPPVPQAAGDHQNGASGHCTPCPQATKGALLPQQHSTHVPGSITSCVWVTSKCNDSTSCGRCAAAKMPSHNGGRAHCPRKTPRPPPQNHLGGTTSSRPCLQARLPAACSLNTSNHALMQRRCDSSQQGCTHVHTHPHPPLGVL